MSSETTRQQQQPLDDAGPSSVSPSRHSDACSDRIVADVNVRDRDRGSARRSGLSLDDLSSDGRDGIDIGSDINNDSDNGNKRSDIRQGSHSDSAIGGGSDRVTGNGTYRGARDTGVVRSSTIGGAGGSGSGGGASTRRVEDKMQQNLRRQQEHYARQRRLFEDLRSDAIAPRTRAATATTTTRGDAVSPSVLSSSSCSDDSRDSEHPGRGMVHNRVRDGNRQCETLVSGRAPSREKVPGCIGLEIENESAGIALKRQSSAVTPSSVNRSATKYLRRHHHRDKRLATDTISDKDALRALSRVKAKARSEYERRMTECQQSQNRRLHIGASNATAAPPLSTIFLSPPPLSAPSSVAHNAVAALRAAKVVDELGQQATANEALRKQLELLRRLQVENNRFRHEVRACREQNEALEDRSSTQKGEIKRLHDDMQRLREDMREMAATIEQDQQRLAAAAQTTRKLKNCQKQLSAAQSESERLQSALHETLELQERSRVKAASDANELAAETKRLKRSLKRLRQHEARGAEENELLRSTVEALESEVNALKRELHAQTRESGDLSSRLADKVSECEALGASAAATAQRMESAMASLQKALDVERDKRKKLETQRAALQTHIGELESDVHSKQQQVETLEHHVTQLQERVRDKKRALQQQRASSDERVDELLAQQQQGAHTIARLRDERERAEQQHATERIAALDEVKCLGDEARAIRAEVEELRSYIDSSLRAVSATGGAVGGTISAGEPACARGESVDVSHDTSDAAADRALEVSHLRSRVGGSAHELQLLQGAASALRAEAMDLVHELQRARHAVRQHAKKLALAQDHGAELERLRAEDASKMQRLREQRALAEQARDIASSEKLEVLKWSQQTCEKSEVLAAELERCGRLARTLLHTLQHRREYVDDSDDGDGNAGPRRRSSKPSDKNSASASTSSPSLLFPSLEREVAHLQAAQQTLREELEQVALERREAASQATTLQRELDTKTREFERMTSELEALHAANAREQRAHFDTVVGDLEREKSELAATLHATSAQSDLDASERARLVARVESLERDVPEFVTLVRLLALVAPPLVLQVSELLSQKRFLLRENAEYAQAQAQVECIGQVLKELVPSPAAVPSGWLPAQRHRRFRRVIIAVFALNRFHKCGVLHQQQQEQAVAPSHDDAADATSGGGSFGSCSSLVAPKKRRSSRISAAAALQRNPPVTVIKVLAPHQNLANLDLQSVLKRLRAMEATKKVTAVLARGESDAEAAVPYIGSLLVQVLSAIDPSVAETLAENTGGAFHCRALVEQRRKGSQRFSQHYRQTSACERDADIANQQQPLPHDEQMGGNNESELSIVDLIRKRILALGKRVEDLHFQRNALQTDNYDLQFELEQQAAQLQQMELLAQQVRELQSELQDARAQQQCEHEAAQQQLNAKHSELEQQQRDAATMQQELVCAETQIQQLQREALTLQETLRALESEKQELHAEATKLKLQAIEEEEKAEVARAGAKKHEDDVRSLKQTARRAHELHEQTNWQLEHEIGERASLQAALDALKQQKAALEIELREAKLRDLERSIDAEVLSPSPQQQSRREKQRPHSHRVRFASTSQRQQRRASVEEESDGEDSEREEDLLSSSERLSVGVDGAASPASNSSGRTAAARVSALAFEDECLYHKYEKPDATNARGDSDSDDGGVSYSRSHSSLSERAPGFQLESSSSRSVSDANSRFLDEWRRLQISSAFDGSERAQLGSRTHSSVQPLRGASTSTSASTSTLASTATAKHIAREVAIQSNRRRIEIDKVNSAVHDYMDRIDEKLQQMYGIPPSTASISSRARVSESRESDDEEKYEDKTDDVVSDRDIRDHGDDSAERGDRRVAHVSGRDRAVAAAVTTRKVTASPAVRASSASSTKTDETRHWFG